MIRYHGSNAKFDAFSDQYLVREDSGPNSALGIWVGDRWVAENFGQYLYVVECDLRRILYMDIRDMVEHHENSNKNPTYFVDIRNNMLEEGYDAIFVKEFDGSCPTGVIMNLSRMTIIETETK